MATAEINTRKEERPAPRKAIDIIVPVYKNVHLASRCLNSLAENIAEIAACDPRVIVINDSPGDADVARMLTNFAARLADTTLIENDTNLGFVKSVNKGLKLACSAGRDVVLVNADTETFSGTLKNLTAAAYADPQIGFASPRSNNASICSLPHFDGTTADRWESYRRWQILSRTMPPFHFTPTGVGFYMYIKHAVLANFGFLDIAFGAGYEEENDLVLRANKVGFRAVLVNNAFAYHAGSASFNLLDINLAAHQLENLRIMAERHSEFLPLVRRYESSAHFRAEALFSRGMPEADKRIKLIFDLSAVGPHFNGTNEMAMAIISCLYERHSSSFDFNVICSLDSFKFHKLDRHDALRCHDPQAKMVERFAVGIYLGQPFSVHAISVLEDLAVTNIFGMLDTIGEDCGYLSITHKLETLWAHVALHANGMFFNSKFSEQCVIARYPEAEKLERYTRLLPTSLRSYSKVQSTSKGEHVLVLGNHFAHKGSDATAEILKVALPNLRLVVLGGKNAITDNVRAYRAGTLDEQQMEALYAKASVVVLPSYVEGFGLGLLHALAAGKVIVARDIPATREILSTYRNVSGVFLYEDDACVASAVRLALNECQSQVSDESTETWEDWVDGFAEYCLDSLRQDDLFLRAVHRIQAGDLLRKAEKYDILWSSLGDRQLIHAGDIAHAISKAGTLTDPQAPSGIPAKHVKELLLLKGEEFICCAYVTLLGRLPDENGLLNYLTELSSGVSKLEVVLRLRQSPEGRRCNRLLPGLRALSVKAKLHSLLGTSTAGVSSD